MKGNRLPMLIVMLTHNDYTIDNPEEVFEQAKGSLAQCWGMKEKPIPPERMKALYARMKECGKHTALEVVGYDEEAAISGAMLAAECGCDYLMGTKFYQSVATYCNERNIRYMPFVGTIEGRPSVLSGSDEEMLREAKNAIQGGAYGIDLLGYRYIGDVVKLNSTIVNSLEHNVCIAGSIDSLVRLDEIKQLRPWAFTIGSAFFDNKFGGTIAEQIDNVCRYVNDIPSCKYTVRH